MKDKRSILIFGGGDLQISIIQKCKNLNLVTIVIDPNENAVGKKHADFFEVVSGNDFESTCEIVDRYAISGVLTAATDKPLVMMARIAAKYNFPFFSVETAINSTDKYLMKLKFQEYQIPCAKGIISSDYDGTVKLPIIVKPRDNSGSRGVFYCDSIADVQKVISKSLSFSKNQTVLIEEVIEGAEYSVESVHVKGKTHVVQYTEKMTTDFPYNVELGHIQPALLSKAQKEAIDQLISKIAIALNFENCVSHTEIKVNSKGIFVIETSPRLGGDYITSDLVPISTGFDIEEVLVKICMNMEIGKILLAESVYAGVFFIQFDTKVLEKNISITSNTQELVKYECDLKEGDEVPEITNSLDRYGYFILKGKNRSGLLAKKNEIDLLIRAGNNV